MGSGENNGSAVAATDALAIVGALFGVEENPKPGREGLLGVSMKEGDDWKVVFGEKEGK